MAKFEVGHKKVGGAVKGQVKKKPVLKLLELLEEEQYDPARELIKKLKDSASDLLDKERCDLNLKLMDFLYSKRRAVDDNGESDIGELANILKEVNGSVRPIDEE